MCTTSALRRFADSPVAQHELGVPHPIPYRIFPGSLRAVPGLPRVIGTTTAVDIGRPCPTAMQKLARGHATPPRLKLPGTDRALPGVPARTGATIPAFLWLWPTATHAPLEGQATALKLNTALTRFGFPPNVSPLAGPISASARISAPPPSPAATRLMSRTKRVKTILRLLVGRGSCAPGRIFSRTPVAGQFDPIARSVLPDET